MPLKKFDEKDRQRLISSAIAGTLATLAGHPIDSVKVRMQISGQPNVSIVKMMTEMARNDGFRAFFRGVLPPMTGKFIATSMFFTMNGWFKDNITQYKIGKEHARGYYRDEASDPVILPLTSIFGVGATCGVMLAPVLSFAELVKIQLQIDKVFKPPNSSTPNVPSPTRNVSNVAHSMARQADLMFGLFNLGGVSSAHDYDQKLVRTGKYSGVFDCAATIIERRAMFRGLSACMLRLIPGWGMYMWSYEVWNRSFGSKNTIGNNRPLDSFSSSIRIIVGGGVAGVMAWVASYPFDYIKTQMQAHPIEKWNVFHTYQKATRPLRMRDVVRETYSKYGIRGFYRGLMPCIYRSIPVNLVQFWSYEIVLQFLQDRRAI